ncbi:hypothetical protein D9M70_437660 [compost metagenome]
MQTLGDVLQGTAGVQVGGAPHGQASASGQHVVIAVARRMQGALCLAVDGDATFALGRGLTSPALAFDQLAHGALAVTHHLSRPSNSGGDHLVVDHHHPQVEA